VDELRALNSGTLEALARTTDAASPWTAGHSLRVTAIAVALAKADGCDDATVDLVRRGSLLHDIGKIAVPVAILDKPAALTAEERAVMNTHPLVGARILQPIAAFSGLLPMVRSHHERWDGTGYPDRLWGNTIHPLARLLAVADVAESMLAARPYRAPLPLPYVAEYIRDNAGAHFDPRLALLFAERVNAGDTELLAALAPTANAALEARMREVA
jgi:putative nucleotidyltransferase with HDIG domain